MNGENTTGNRAAAWFRDWMPLIMLCVSGLVWGMKLENDAARKDAVIALLNTRISHLEAEVDRGILPRAEERIVALESRVAKVEVSCEEFRSK